MGRKTIGRFVNTTPTAVAVNTNLTFSNNTISTNCIGYASDGSITLRAPGVYRVSANFVVTSTAGGTATINMLENGALVPGATASATVAAGAIEDLAFTTVTTVRSECGASPQFATLTFNNVNAMTYNVANVIVEKIA